MKKRLAVIFLIVLMLTVIWGCSTKAPETQNKQKPLTKVSVMLDWTTNTNHTGLYAAKEKGYFRDEGLDVEILESGDPGPAQLVAANQVDFGVSYQEQVTYARAEDIPLVSLAAVIQHNTSGFASLQETNIKSPKDLEGKRYGGWGSPEEHAVIEGIMSKAGADPEKVTFIDIGSVDFFSVIGERVDFTWIFYGWDGVRAELKKTPLNILMLKDLDPALDYYTPVLVTSEKNIAERPDIVKKFMSAVSKGYEFSINEPESAANILLKHAPELDKDLVLASQKWLSSQYKSDAPYWGMQKSNVWANYAAWMMEKELLSKEIKIEEAFTNEFLPKV